MTKRRAEPALRKTKDYSIFDQHELNRPLHRDPQLEASMQKHGFRPWGAIHCVPNGAGKLKILQGHHRFHVAKTLGLAIWYIVDDSNLDIFELEGCRTRWDMRDFTTARAHAGNKECSRLLALTEKHHTPLCATASILCGWSTAGNASRTIRRGTFTASNLSFGQRVLSIVDACKEAGIEWASSSGFIYALAAVCLVPQFDEKTFLHRARLHPGQMTRRGTQHDCLTEIEELYNWGSRGKRIPLKFLAIEASKERKRAAFGPGPRHTVAGRGSAARK